MIIGTVTGSWGTFYFTDEPGLGAALGPDHGAADRHASPVRCSPSIHALATVTFRVDQIVSGVVINLVAIGLARFLSTVFFGQATQSDSGTTAAEPDRHPGSIGLPLGTGRGLRPAYHRW